MPRLRRSRAGTRLRIFSLVLALLAAASSPALRAEGKEPPGFLAPLLDGSGTYSRPLPECAAEAQPYFDQGLRLTYGYYFPEALASFREAARLDPGCAMAYWGAALTIGPVPNSRYNGFPDDPKKEGIEAIRSARELASTASEKDRNLIEALWQRYDPSVPDRRTRDDNYLEAMKAVLRDYPGDPDAAVLYADALMVLSPWDYFWPDGSMRPGTAEALAALEGVMREQPDHPGGPHYYIHIVENSQTPEIGMKAADLLEALMPGAGHVVHMPSHIYIRAGLYGKAVEINKRSVAADGRVKRQWGERPMPQGVTTYPLSSRTHPVHAHDFLHMAAEWQGNYKEAMASAETIAGIVRPMIGTNGGAQRRFVRPMLTDRRFAKWDRILAMEGPPGSPPFVRAVWHFVRGSALAATGKAGQAESELKELRAVAAMPEMATLRTRTSPARWFLEIASHALAGEIAASRGSTDEAVGHMEAAVRLEDGMKYVEPPDWSDPVRHQLGDLLLDAGRPREAEFIYWEALRRHRNNGWSLHGLMKSLEAQGRKERAAEVKARFEKAWAGADTTLRASRP